MSHDLTASASKLLKPYLRCLTIQETALKINVSIKTIRRLIEAGDLPKICVRRSIRISEHDLERYLQRNRK